MLRAIGTAAAVVAATTAGVAILVAVVPPGIEHCTAPPGELTLLVSDTHVQQLLPLSETNMARVVKHARRRFPRIQRAVVLGDLIHNAGGTSGGNVSTTLFRKLAKRVRALTDGLPTDYVPGNHDLVAEPTARWLDEFGTPDTVKTLSGQPALLATAASTEPADDCEVVLVHQPTNVRCNSTRLVVRGHWHFSADWTTDGVRTVVVPTLNPYQAAINHQPAVSGGSWPSGQQGFGLLGYNHTIEVCVVSWTSPNGGALIAAVVVAAVAVGVGVWWWIPAWSSSSSRYAAVPQDSYY